MSDKKFDDFLKDSFSGYAPEVPSHIWDNIAAGRKKKRTGFFLLNEKRALVVLLLLLMAGGGIYLAVNLQSGKENITHENNGSRQAAGETAPAVVLKNGKGETADKISAGGELPDAKETGAGVNAAPEATTLANNTTKAAVTATAGTEASLAHVNRGSDNKLSVTGRRKRLQKQHGYIKSTLVQAPAEDDMADSAATIVNSDVTETAGQPVSMVAGTHERLLLNYENLVKKQVINALPVLPKKEDCPGGTSGANYYIEAYISPDYAMKKYSDTANSALVAKRKESLKVQSAYSAGLRYTRVFTNGMSVRTGFNYSQVNEKFSYAKDNVVQIVYVINNQGDTTDRYYVNGTRYKTSYNRYRNIDVPLVVGYEMGNGDFHANINAGVMVNIYSWQTGETLDNTGEPVSITTGKPDNPYQYKTNIGIGFTSAVSLYYRLNERFHVLAEPYFRYNLSPMNRETISLQERFTTIGLRLGIRMDIK